MTPIELIEALDKFLELFKCRQSADMVAKNIIKVDEQHDYASIQAALKKLKLDTQFDLVAEDPTKLDKHGKPYKGCTLFSKTSVELKNFAKAARGTAPSNAAYKQSILNGGVF